MILSNNINDWIFLPKESIKYEIIYLLNWIFLLPISKLYINILNREYIEEYQDTKDVMLKVILPLVFHINYIIINVVTPVLLFFLEIFLEVTIRIAISNYLESKINNSNTTIFSSFNNKKSDSRSNSYMPKISFKDM